MTEKNFFQRNLRGSRTGERGSTNIEGKGERKERERKKEKDGEKREEGRKKVA